MTIVGIPTGREHVVASIQKDYQIGSEDINDVVFVGQKVRWSTEKPEIPSVSESS
jgi:hypothetical protein